MLISVLYSILRKFVPYSDYLRQGMLQVSKYSILKLKIEVFYDINLWVQSFKLCLLGVINYLNIVEVSYLLYNVLSGKFLAWRPSYTANGGKFDWY